MPTRITLQERSPSKKNSYSKNWRHERNGERIGHDLAIQKKYQRSDPVYERVSHIPKQPTDVEAQGHTASIAAPAIASFQSESVPQSHPSAPPKQHLLLQSINQRKRSSFRSSILRDLSDIGKGTSSLTNHSRNNNDIKISPRLLGYVFSLTACAIMLASVIQFYSNQGTIPPEFADSFNSDRYFVTPTQGVILWWKLWGAMAVSGLSCIVYFVMIGAHFNTVCLPNLWITLFRDGSIYERNLLILLILYWVAGIHINTSSLSVGELQPNVFITTWIVFISTVSNLALWREAAGLPKLFSKDSYKRETTYNWIWTAFFAIIFAGSITDSYIYRDEVSVQSNGKPVAVSWTVILSLLWGDVFVCGCAIFLNHLSLDPYVISCRLCLKSRIDPPLQHQPEGDHNDPGIRSVDEGHQSSPISLSPSRMTCVFGWQQLEGVLLLVAMGVKYYIVLDYTGVNTVINGLTNAYAGAWGTFFNSVFTFGTWLKENRKTRRLT